MVHWLVEEGRIPFDPLDGTPCALAAMHGNLPLLQFLVGRGYLQDSQACHHAAYSGHLHVLQWLRAQAPPCPWDSNTCWWAAGQGHLEVLRWARSQEPACPWSDNEAAAAARGGHVHVLEFLVEQGQPLHPYVCAAAVEGGHLDALKWLRLQDPPCPWDEDSVGPAALGRTCLDRSQEPWAALRTWLAANTPYYPVAASMD